MKLWQKLRIQWEIFSQEAENAIKFFKGVNERIDRNNDEMEMNKSVLKMEFESIKSLINNTDNSSTEENKINLRDFSK